MKTMREKQLESALREVMQWIDGWSPNFIYDEEWPETKSKIDSVLNSNSSQQKAEWIENK